MSNRIVLSKEGGSRTWPYISSRQACSLLLQHMSNLHVCRQGIHRIAVDDRVKDGDRLGNTGIRGRAVRTRFLSDGMRNEEGFAFLVPKAG